MVPGTCTLYSASDGVLTAADRRGEVSHIVLNPVKEDF